MRKVFVNVFLIGMVISGYSTWGSDIHSSVTSPSFLVEPPSYVDFYNGSGTTVPCSAKGFPQPNVTWSRQDSTEPVSEISNLRYVRGDGALVLPPFASQDYRQEIHDAIYHCLLSNSAGTIASREVRVRGVVRRSYEVRTFDEFAIRGNTAVLRCEVPTGVKEYVKIVSWETNDGRTYSGPSEGKYSVTSEGLLLIRNVDFIDSRAKYRCMTRDKLYGNSITSATWGELIVTEAIRSLPVKLRIASRKVRCPSGHTAELVCVAQGHPQPSTVWFRRTGKRVNPLAYSQRYHRQPGGGLLIKKTTIYDTGSYICLLNNSVSEDRVQIELLVTESLSVTVTPENILVTEGMTVTLYCNVTGYPINNVVWKKNFQALATSTRMTMLSQEVLEISSVQRGDNGMYQCFVYGGDSTSAQGAARLALKEEAPVFNEVFPERVLRIGSSTSLKCVVDGNPLPQIQWKLYGRAVVESATLRIGDFVDVSGSLQSFVNISSVSVDQGGSYSCTANNDFGSSTHSARVHVVGAPYVHPMNNESVISGGSVILTCASAGYPIEHYTWKKGQHELPRSQRIIVHRNGSVTLLQAVKEDEGWYRCEAKSGRGERAQGNIYLKVIEKPVINPFLFGGDLREEMRTTVVCSVLTGERGLTIEWLKNGRPLKLIHPEAQVASIGDFTSSLTLNGVQRRHSGNYTCKVTSGSVTSEYSARMNVNASPKWVKKPSDVAVIRGDRVVLDCKAEGEPEPVHRWKHMQGSKNGAAHSEFRSVVSSPHMHVLENGSLVITEVDKSDSGAYLCDVNNGIAPALSAVVEVSVKVPPFFQKSFEVLTVNMSSNAVMVCSASGDLPITITWAKNRRPIDYNNSPRFVVQEFPVTDGLRSELLINQVNKMDSALFTCDASNEFGREERSVHFVVEAPPDSPSNLRVTQLSSSTATVTWTQTQSGNSPVTGYIVHFGPVSENWESGSSSIRATEAQVVLTGLKPGNTYKVKIISANAIGTSDASDELTFTTEEAAPSKPPSQVTAIATSSKSLKITWKPIDQSTENSQILGYYVGYKETDTSGSHVFKTIDNVNGQTGEVELTNLSKSTKYSVSVQAFNKKGAGPMSEEIVVQTLEFDPPSAPKISLIRKSTNSVEIEWSYRENDNPITGYLLNYKASSNGDWQEIRLPSSNTRHYLEGLLCGSQYFVTLTAYNKAGKGTPSEPFSVKTTGNIPVPPKQEELLVVNSSAASLRLTAWNDGGCPIAFYVIQYKPRRHADWILLSNRILPGDGIATVSDLAAGSWYDLLMTAHNEAGANEGEYSFATLTLTGATVAPESKGSTGLGSLDAEASAFQDPAVIVPIICAAVVVLVIAIVVTVVMVLRRKDNASECQSQGAYSASSVGKAENMSMVSYGKIKRGDLTEEHQRESLYYPTPYATTQIAGENEGHHHHHGGGGLGPPQGTLRRVGRIAREHEYDIPQRLVQSGDYTPYAKLWTHTRNTSGDSNYGVGSKTGQPLSYLRTARSPHPLIKSCTQLGNEGDHLTSSGKDFSESGEFSETECDRDHHDLSLRVAQNDKTPNLRFTVEPPALVNFPHSSGARVPCVATGQPPPIVSWISGNVSTVVGQRGLRSVEPDGSLEFFPFRPDQYRQDIHDAVYRCLATNSQGTIGSRDVKVKAVISGPAEVRVDDDYVSLRNTAVFRCQVPTPTGNHVTLSEFQTDDGMAFIADASTEVNYGRYQIFRPGILHISGVTPTDAMKKYGCRMKNLLTGEILKTTNYAKLILSESPEQYPPRFVDEPMKWTYHPNEIAYLPCVAHSNPPAQYRWYRLEGGRTLMVNLGSRAEVRDGTLILRRVTLADSGTYICMANNSFGHGRIERELVVTAPLRVEISPSKMRVSPGEEVYVNCTVSGGPVHGVFWMKDQKPLSALGSRIRQLSVKSIQIRSFQHDHSGFYQCYAFNERDSAQGVVEVCQRAEPPTFVNTFSKQLTMAGRSVSLACVANGWPTVQIRWLLDGSEIPDDGHVVFGDHVYKNNSVASYVNISSIKPQDGGLYKCTATNEMGTATHSGRIDILGPPVVRATKNITIAASETVILTCPVSGYPIKEIVVERGSRRLPYNERHNVLDKGTIQIYGVRKEDEGIYRCIAHSGRGERAEGTLVLQVVSAPVISPFSFPSNLQEGMRISATCTVIAGDAPVAIHWTKDSNPVNHVGSEVEVLSLTDFVSSLIINKLSRRHTGNYTCSAVNSVSAVNFTSRMVVHAAPQWTIVPEEKMATAGSSVLFDCQAQGEPNPVVRWKREEDTKPLMYHNILSSPQMHVLENGSLHITTVSKADQGYYLCEVTNGIGENLRSRVKLTVHNLPQVQSASHTVKGRKGEKTQLSCSASGDPPLTVSWRKDGVPIHTHGNSGRYLNQDPSNEKGSTKVSRLILLSAERDDSALFTCIASNPFGEDKADLRVIIQEPPDSPTDLRPMDVTNSAIALSWTPPFNGNSPITSYTITYKNEIGQWRSHSGKDIRLSGEDTSTTITDLEPITTYRIQVVAENALGVSAPSRDLEVTTRKGAPRHAPEEVTVVALNSTAIKVSWKVPATLSDRPHLIDGFYIGYRVAGSENNLVYSTVSVNSNKNTEEFVISSLNRYSRYTVVVQAFNSEGAGPSSDELAVQTYEFDPPGQPILKLHSVTSSTISVTWEMPVDQNPVSGFVLRYKESNSGWNEIQISELRSSYTVEALRCGSPYNLRLTAFNNVGSGEPSHSVQVTTSGKAPVAPDRGTFLRCNSTFVTCNLRAWLDNGCVISHFVIQYKAKTEGDWVLISNHILPSEESVYLTDLLPGTWYVMLMSAHNDAGITEKNYEFATLTASGATVPPMAMSTANAGSLFEDPTILVPIICAIVVLIVIIAVTAVVLAWKRRDAAETSEVCSGNSGGRADDISMCSYGKVKGGGGGNSSIYQPQREPLYFPSPYATSHVSGGADGGAANALTSEAQHRHHIQSGYSESLRRHPGSRMGEHVYDIPQRPQQRSDLQCSGHQYSRLWTTRPSGLRLPLVGDNEKKECEALVMSNAERELCRQSLGMYYHSDLSESPSADEVGCLATRIDTQEASDLDGFSETECDRDHTINRRYLSSDLLPETIIVMC